MAGFAPFSGSAAGALEINTGELIGLVVTISERLLQAGWKGIVLASLSNCQMFVGSVQQFKDPNSKSKG